MSARLQKALKQIPYLGRTLALVHQAAGRDVILWGLLLAAMGLLPAWVVALSRPLIDQILRALREQNSAEITAALYQAAVIAALVLLGEVLKSAASYLRLHVSEKVQDHISGLVYQQSIAVDLAFYETPDFFDHLHRARSEATFRPVLLLDTLGTTLQNGITLAAMAIILARFGWWLPLLLLGSTLPALFVVLRSVLRRYEWQRESTPIERRTWYLDWLLTSADAAAELRLFGLGAHFADAHAALRTELRQGRMRIAAMQVRAELVASIIGWISGAGASVWMVWRVANGVSTPGDLVLFYQAMLQGLRLMRTLLENAGQVYGNVLFLGNLFEYLELKPQVVSPPKALPAAVTEAPAIAFRRVTFTYPRSTRAIFEDFNLNLEAGRITAIVGENGAGKSTLVKLICRLYDPSVGAVQINGRDLRDCDLDHLRRQITVLFQQPLRYSDTVHENIARGDITTPSTDAAITTAAQAAGADTIIDNLPDRYNTMLGKWFSDGTELSGGEWQRIALARAFLRQSPILVLDEPTSAMDPWSEADWLTRFRSLAQGKTVLVITHRFTTAMYADQIHVVDKGRIIESGSHHELLEAGGRYAQGWRSQHRA